MSLDHTECVWRVELLTWLTVILDEGEVVSWVGGNTAVQRRCRHSHRQHTTRVIVRTIHASHIRVPTTCCIGLRRRLTHTCGLVDGNGWDPQVVVGWALHWHSVCWHINETLLQRLTHYIHIRHAAISTNHLCHIHCITSANEVIFSPVCVCLSVNSLITHKYWSNIYDILWNSY